MIRTTYWNRIALAAVTLFVLTPSGDAGASLARNAAGGKNIGEARRLVVDTAGEIERDADDKVWTLEASAQYQLTKRLQVLVEGLVLEALQPRDAPNVSGFGDTDVTLSLLLARSRGAFPSLVLSGKAKLPTATQDAIGTGKPDYSGLLILEKEAGELELSLETEYATYGQPGGVELKSQFLYTLTAEYALNDFLAIYGEVFGISAPTAADSRQDAARLGIEVDIPVSERIAPYLSVEMDSEATTAARAGVEWSW